ncbi:biotin synthase [Breznakia sp. PF5-3]|uniref:[FeFe] hydrogenase H-cluster radical SAM maturase HydE n=1 Tax=unclassified Breznakia TaxID=2623764 RepID=UPI0024061CFB|nr:MULTISPECIES: [FeFe] hydrogenase H-cluster radical SAM maturase HydE [unclassified Breznakia]MDF9824096.1 biotin synthase [Breznakia sp. PM6-1]MDF9834838.1 biotin synthase [Breznakia sp. PF5-3]MDF9837140.1 biotin synthase [Breznakia sp. PFB2-8]MDF9859065.1 biotin synthase [Breznakia sp. PH5-24]
MKLIDKLRNKRHLEDYEYEYLLTKLSDNEKAYLFEQARAVAQENFGNKVFIRGLIEFSNYCKNNCYYCGIRRDNEKVERYRLNKEDVLECCQTGYQLGFRTFVLQSGEDDSYRVNEMSDIIRTIRDKYPDCAITLSMGEKDKHTYEQYFHAGANRYLLRHESINEKHYASLHPEGMHIQTRVQCLKDLKEIGFQTGSGIMVGSPKQTTQNLIEDIKFLEELSPEMIGIGPYLPHEDTPFKEEAKGSMDTTLILLAIMRLMHPQALIPSTTALATIDPTGRDQGILAGANVVMPNLSPLTMRKKYQLYNDKACMDDEAAESLDSLNKRLEKIGYTISYDRGDFKGEKDV